MQKNAILKQRKELKRKSHAIVKSHYFVLVFLMLLLTLFGTEFRGSLSGWGETSEEKNTDLNDPGSVFDDLEIVSGEDVFSAITAGRIAEGVRGSERLEQMFQEEGTASKALGRTNGVLAQLVNAVGSGRLFARLAQTIQTITHSDEAVSVIFVIGSFLWYALIFIFLKNVLSAVVRRVFLQARVYSSVSVTDITFFAAVKKWIHACWVMLVQYVFYCLWTLTIVGALIKRYSYWAVPYIVAENPAIGAKDAINLSRKMMYGHKLELFKYEMTLLGWILLGAVTFGISDLVYGNAYRMACYSEFYGKIREHAKEEELEGSDLLNDPFLFEAADRILLYETYFDVVDEITVLHENRIELTGWRKKVADWFGIWFGSLKKKKAYDAQEGRSFAVERYRLCMDGKAYPNWLSPLWIKRKMEDRAHFTYLRNYTVWTLFLLFVAFCFVGWSWEVSLHFMQTGQFANRGTLHGPWLPIYGTGGIIVLILCSRFRKKPVVEFFVSILLCGVLEYFSGWYLEMRYHQRWWSYDGYFLNLHGRICAEGLLVFGVGCCTVVYLVAPLFDHLLSMIKEKVLIGIALALAIVYGADVIYSGQHPNMAEGAVEEIAAEEIPETESLTETEQNRT